MILLQLQLTVCLVGRNEVAGKLDDILQSVVYILRHLYIEQQQQRYYYNHDYYN